MTHPLRRRDVQVLLLLALVAECAVIAYLVLNPSAAVPTTVVTRASDWLSRHGVPAGLADGDVVEFVLNAGMFVPTGMTLRLLVPRVPWWAWSAVGLAAAGTIELIQWGFLEGRSASWRDTWANTIGVAAGAAVVALIQLSVRLIRHSRRARLALL